MADDIPAFPNTPLNPWTRIARGLRRGIEDGAA